MLVQNLGCTAQFYLNFSVADGKYFITTGLHLKTK